mmetsp:Transcript_18702/g.52612  ORF Transcript_18702/g.52612 Transcript_18702/m.52612 type:complete len:208 (-) Transcript_18702:207-830(-)
MESSTSTPMSGELSPRTDSSTSRLASADSSLSRLSPPWGPSPWNCLRASTLQSILHVTMKKMTLISSKASASPVQSPTTPRCSANPRAAAVGSPKNQLHAVLMQAACICRPQPLSTPLYTPLTPSLSEAAASGRMPEAVFAITSASEVKTPATACLAASSRAQERSVMPRATKRQSPAARAARSGWRAPSSLATRVAAADCTAMGIM